MRRKKNTDQDIQFDQSEQGFQNYSWGGEYGVNQLNAAQSDDSFSLSGGYEEPQGVKTFNAEALIFGLIGGFVGAVLAIILNALVIRGLLDPDLNLHICQILMIGSGMMLTGTGAMAGVFLSGMAYPTRLRLNPSAGLILGIAAVALMGTGCLMQFLYSLGGVSIAVPADDYVFVIDDSGSMSSTDPQNARVSSLGHMVDRFTEDNQIGLVFFNEGIVFESQMEPMSAAKANECKMAVNMLRNSGGTNLGNAIGHALNMQGVNDPDRLTEIVLLTDGQSGWINTKEIVKLCNQYNVRISAIALSNAINAGVLQRITRMTGGALYPVEKLDDLLDVYSKIGVVSNVRDLLGIRSGTDHGSFWLGLLRVLSWALAGAIVGMALMLAIDSEPRHVPMIMTGAGVLFGVLLELFNLLWLDGTIFSTNWKMLLVPMIFIPILFYMKEKEIVFSGMQIDWPQQSANNKHANKLNTNQDDHMNYRL